jgi:hypothetical protein
MRIIKSKKVLAGLLALIQIGAGVEYVAHAAMITFEVNGETVKCNVADEVCAWLGLDPDGEVNVLVLPEVATRDVELFFDLVAGTLRWRGAAEANQKEQVLLLLAKHFGLTEVVAKWESERESRLVAKKNSYTLFEKGFVILGVLEEISNKLKKDG